MADYNRKCVPFGAEIRLRAIFTDGCGNPIDVDDISGIEVAIYRPNDFDLVTDVDAEVTNDFPNAFNTTEVDAAENPPVLSNGTFVPIAAGADLVRKLATGYYEVIYRLPVTADINIEDDPGVWTDVWTGFVNGTEVNSFFTFVAEEKGTVQSQRLYNNSLVVILLDKGIKDINGNELEEEIQLSFSTTYSPYHASVDLLRLECGSWLDGIPDDTLSLMIHWASIEADAITGSKKRGNLYRTALTKFVLYDAALRCLMLPADAGGKTKSLGDLMIETTSDFSTVILDLKEKREEWFRVVNAGGTIVPGQGLAPALGLKGSAVTDSSFGRMWHDPNDVNYGMPSQNARFALKGSRKKRHGWKKR